MANIDIVEKTIEKSTYQAIYDAELVNFQLFQKEAQNFLTNIKLLMYRKTKNSSLKTIAQNFVNANMSKKNENNPNFTDIMGYLADFEHSLNTFLNRKEYLTYVCQNGQLKLYDEVGLKSIYQKMEVEGTSGRGKIKAENYLEEVESISRGAFIQKINNSTANKCRIYAEALRRWNKKPDEKSKKGMRYKAVDSSLTKTFYFRAHAAQHLLYWSVVTKPSTIAQAYVDEVVNDTNISFNNVNLEWSLSHLNEKLQETFKPNSIGGIIKGDVQSTGMIGEINYAVKSGVGFWSSPRIKQYIALAYNVLLFDKLTPEELKNNLKKMSSIRTNSQKILQLMTDYSKEEIQSKILKANNLIQINF